MSCFKIPSDQDASQTLPANPYKQAYINKDFYFYFFKRIKVLPQPKKNKKKIDTSQSNLYFWEKLHYEPYNKIL